MELLNKSIAIFVFMSVINTAFSQASQEALLAAFSKSYAFEKNGDFSASLDPLKKVCYHL